MRTILHCDLNNFYASVECVLNPMLRDKYVAVCGDKQLRHGIVLAKNNKAKACGVKTGDVIWEAKQKCPELVCVAPHYEIYMKYSQKAREIYYRYTDKVETFGMDECWLDVTQSMFLGNGEKIANDIRRVIREETGLTVSVGVSFNKIFAKLGSDMKKPDATTIINFENFKEKVWNLAVSDLLMVGSSTTKRLKLLNINTIGELAVADSDVLRYNFGINGLMLKKYALGLDDSLVSAANSFKEIKSVGQGSTPVYDMDTYESAEKLIMFLSELIGRRLRRYGLVGQSAHIGLRYNNLSGISRQKQICPTFVADDMYREFDDLLHKSWNPKTDLPLRTITISVGHLSEYAKGIQLSLFDCKKIDIKDKYCLKGKIISNLSNIGEILKKKEDLQFTVDKIREKYGFSSVLRGANIENSTIYGSQQPDDQLLPFRNEGIKIKEPF